MRFDYIDIRMLNRKVVTSYEYIIYMFRLFKIYSDNMKVKEKAMIVIKPHHLIDIVKLYGAGIECFVPDEAFQHDFYKVANSIVENLNIPIRFTIDGDDICKPCNRYNGSTCTDPVHSIQGYHSKDTYNKELDTRLINQLGLDVHAIYTVKQFLMIADKNQDIIFDVWQEENEELTQKRNRLFRNGVKKLLK